MALTINLAMDLKSMKNLASRRGVQMHNMRNIRSRKCLFGASNEEETYQLVKENFASERDRFYQRFGIHMEDIDKMTIDEDEFRRQKYRPIVQVAVPMNTMMVQPQPCTSNGGGGKIATKKTIRMKRVLKPYNANNQQNNQQNSQQMRITDFCQVKKSPTSNNLEPANKNGNVNGKKVQPQNLLC